MGIRTLALLAFSASALAETPSIYVIGDSTANNADHCGWGDPFAAYFDGKHTPFRYPALSYNLADVGSSGQKLYMPIP